MIYLHSDQLGSASVVTDSNGAVLSQQDFDPWGSIRTVLYATGTIGQTDVNYTGQVLYGSGLLYYHARYYDPFTSRFVSPDSVVPGTAMGKGGALTVDFHEPVFISNQDKFKGGPTNPQNLNRYSYATNDPLIHTDPTGHQDLGEMAGDGGSGEGDGGDDGDSNGNGGYGSSNGDVRGSGGGGYGDSGNTDNTDATGSWTTGSDANWGDSSGDSSNADASSTNGDANNASTTNTTTNWSSGNSGDPDTNANKHWNAHGSDFPQYQTRDQYVDGANNFVNNPPSDVQSKVSGSGNYTYYYDADSNTFAVTNSDGVPSTMFKPSGDGQDYYDKQS